MYQTNIITTQIKDKSQMKAQYHLTSLEKKVLNYMLENKLTNASTAIKEFKSLQNDGNN